jgi:hypothetical protein
LKNFFFYLDPPFFPFGDNFLRVNELILLKLLRNSLFPNLESASHAPEMSPSPELIPGTLSRVISVSPIVSEQEVRRSESTTWLEQLSLPLFPENSFLSINI